MNETIYDVCIIGGGPAGVAGGIYAARKRMRTALVTETFGGQSLVSAEIQNWIGDIALSGLDLAKRLETHLKAQSGIDIIEGERVTAVLRDSGGLFRCLLGGGIAPTEASAKGGRTITARAVLVASGSRRRRLGIPGEDRYDGKGVAFCATCDAPLFGGKPVAVVGGGNSGLESVVDLLPYASKVYLLHRGQVLKGDKVTEEKIAAHPNATIIRGATPVEILGDAFVTGLTYRLADGATATLDVAGVFVEVGSIPNSELVASLVERTHWGEIIVDHRTQRTSCEGVWAAGDVATGLYKQNNISAGESITAILNIYDSMHGIVRPAVAREKPPGT
ncbi:MAG: FAD-dependent oxidoreductase [bacterium]|nr:FAD-dependent oxidoreductase [bacterium]